MRECPRGRRKKLSSGVVVKVWPAVTTLFVRFFLYFSREQSVTERSSEYKARGVRSMLARALRYYRDELTRNGHFPVT